jgi:hypothetical protein
MLRRRDCHRPTLFLPPRLAQKAAVFGSFSVFFVISSF